MLDLIIKNGTCYLAGKLQKIDIGVTKDKITQLGNLNSEKSKDLFDELFEINTNQTILDKQEF